MPRHIKTAALAGQQEEADAKVREHGRDASSPMSPSAATRRCANCRERFDKWSPPSFRLAPRRDRRARRQGRAADDRRHQIRASADPQFRRDPARLAAGCRGRDLARRRARPSAHPGRQCRLLCAGRALPDGRLGAYVDRHRPGRRGRPHHRLHPAEPGRPASRDDRRDASRRRRRDPCVGRRPGGGGDGARHRELQAGRHAGRPRQRLCRRGQAPALRPGRHRPLRRPDRDPGHRRRDRRRRDVRDRSVGPGRARPDLAGDPADHLGEARACDDRRGRPAADRVAAPPMSPGSLGATMARSSSAPTRTRWWPRPTASPPSMSRC